MAPTSLHALLPRDGPSLGELFHHFPAKVWLFFKFIIFGLALLLSLYGIIIGVVALFLGIRACGPDLIRSLRTVKWRDVAVSWRDKVGRLRKIERLERMWKWLERKSARWKAESVDPEELEHLGRRNDEGREGSVDGETLFEGKEDEDGDGDGQARKKEEIELDSEDYMKNNPTLRDKSPGRNHY